MLDDESSDEGLTLGVEGEDGVKDVISADMFEFDDSEKK